MAAGALCVAGPLTVAQAQSAGAPLPDNVAQTPPPPPPGVSPSLDSARAVRGDSLDVVVYTYGPGDEVFERFGHIALAIVNRHTGQDVAFNWGMFDFNAPNFLGRFLTGDTRYWMEGYVTGDFNALYRSQDRSIRKQVLALSPLQKGALFDYVVQWNAREENRYYRYDYYNDNCSTRVRDALDWALGGALQRAWADVNGHHTWRDETVRITADNLPVYAGIQIALGRNADTHLTRWQQAFLPEYLAQYAATTTVNGAPLVVQDTMLYTARREPLADHAPNRTLPALAIGVLLAVLIVILARVPATSGALLSVIGTTWYLLGGVLGTALLLAGTVTKHAPYMGSNLNLFTLSPLLLFAAVAWPWRARTSQIGKGARALAALVAVLALVGLVLMHVPGIAQGSMLVFMLMVPVHAALAWAVLRRPR